MNSTFSPLFIIGCPRSGTNALRDALCSLDEFFSWDCDEINYVWRHVKPLARTDILTASDASHSSVSYIRGYIDKFYRQKAGRLCDVKTAPVLIEKTCANTLRLDFIDRCFPTAKYIYIKRNPADVVSSSVKRWQHKDIDLRYLLKKLRYVPVTDLPLYSSMFLANKLKVLFSPRGIHHSWGPRVPGIDSIRDSKDIYALAAYQWKYCSLSAESFFENQCVPSRYYTLTYEDLVRDYKSSMTNMLSHLRLPISVLSLDALENHFYSHSVRMGANLSESHLESIRDGISSAINTYESNQ